MTKLDSADIVAFKTEASFRHWLEAHHASSTGIWLHLFKKGSGVNTVTYAEALDQALCFGWIDGQAKPRDGHSWLLRFTPRRPKSKWSKINTNHAARLISAGQMAPAGQAQIDAAKADGRWEAAYASSRDATPPQDFLAALAGNAEAQAFYATLNKANVFAIVYRLQNAKKPQTRERWISRIIDMLAQGKLFHP